MRVAEVDADAGIRKVVDYGYHGRAYVKASQGVAEYDG